jgi:hypothetical protein
VRGVVLQELKRIRLFISMAAKIVAMLAGVGIGILLIAWPGPPVLQFFAMHTGLTGDWAPWIIRGFGVVLVICSFGLVREDWRDFLERFRQAL